MLHQAIRQAAEKKLTPEKKIRAISLAYLAFSEDHKNYFDIINYFLTSPETIFPPELKNEIDEHGDASIATLTDAIREGIDAGRFKAVDPRRQAIILWSAFNGMIQLKKLQKTILGKDQYQSLYLEIVDRFFDGLRKP
jgi:hypothetical protein